MLYRLMYDTASMTAGSDFIEMAQLLGAAATPAEAQTILEKAMNGGLINDQQKERTTRLLNSFKGRAEADKKGLAQLDAEATKNPTGELDVKLGEVYYGFSEYQSAVTAINRGLQKWPDQARGRGVRLPRSVGIRSKGHGRRQDRCRQEPLKTVGYPIPRKADLA